MADIKIVDLNLGTVLGANDALVLVQGDTTLQVSGQSVAEGVKAIADLADKAYVDAIVAGAPELLDTLNEIAAAIGDDPNFSSSIRTILDSKLPTANFGFEFWNAISGVTTYHIAEDSNLYFTEQRVRDALSNQLTTESLNVKNITFTGTGAVNIGSGNDLNLSAAGNITFNGQTLSSVAISGSYNDLTDIPTSPTYNSVTVLNEVTSPNHVATKSYVDNQLNALPPPVWNSLSNVSNDQGPTRIALGRNAGGESDADGYGGYGAYGGGSSPFAIAIGNSAGRTNQGGAAIGIGVATGYIDQGEGAIAIGLTAGNTSQGMSAVAVGESSGNTSQGLSAIAIGNTAGYTNQGTNAIAIGKNAGRTNQPAGSIVISASGNELNGNATGFYVDPIRSATATDYVAYYNPTTKEVTYGPAPSGGSSGTDPTFTSVTTGTLNVQNVAFTGTGAVTITSGNDLNLVAAGNIQVNGETFATVATSGSYNDLTNKPTVNYVQTIGNPVTVPSGSSLPFTIISGTITTTGNPVRIHISGDCYSNTGGNPKIQIYRGTTGLGRRMTITNNGSAIPYAIEVIDPVAAGTYTYSLKISSGSIGNGTFFGADDGNVLTITELK